MAVITVFGMLAVPASAASLSDSGTVTIQQAGYGNYLSKSTGGTIGGGYWKYTSNNGLTGTAYCVNHGLKGVSPSKALTVQEYNQEPKTMGAFANGYPNRTLAQFKELHASDVRGIASLTEDEYKYATQLAVWATCGQLAVPGTSFTAGSETLAEPTSDAQKIRVYDRVKTILRLANGWTQYLHTGLSLRAEENRDVRGVEIIHDRGLAGAAENNTDSIKKETIKMKGIILSVGRLLLMNENYLTTIEMSAFEHCLRSEEREPGTIKKYLWNIQEFAVWLGDRPATKEMAAEWKEHLRAEGYQPVTINSMLSALNKFFAFMGWNDCRLKYLKVQRRLFRSTERELTKTEYLRLLETAHGLGKTRLALLMETICSTGIRVSEVKYITVEAIQSGRADISLKGKIRTILIPGKLCRKLQKYAKKHKTISGEIFLTRNGKGLTRRQIWAEMKALCKKAGVAPSKVFPHNLRHLFARTFYHIYKDVAKLADVLGHSSIETTRIYLISTGTEHARQLERLGLIS